MGLAETWDRRRDALYLSPEGPDEASRKKIDQQAQLLASIPKRYATIEGAKMATFLDLNDEQELGVWLEMLGNQLGDATPFKVEDPQLATIVTSAENFEQHAAVVSLSFKEFVLRRDGQWYLSPARFHRDKEALAGHLARARDFLERDLEASTGEFHAALDLAREVRDHHLVRALAGVLAAVKIELVQHWREGSSQNPGLPALLQACHEARVLAREAEAPEIRALAEAEFARELARREDQVKRERATHVETTFREFLEPRARVSKSEVVQALGLSDEAALDEWFFWLFDYDATFQPPFKCRHDEVHFRAVNVDAAARDLARVFVEWQATTGRGAPDHDPARQVLMDDNWQCVERGKRGWQEEQFAVARAAFARSQAICEELGLAEGREYAANEILYLDERMRQV